MTFDPALPLTGLPGWALLNRTLERQTALFNASPEILRDTDYFREHISEVNTAEDLVSDRRLLRVALGAFGLQDDINNRAFIRSILQEGTTDDDALANRLSDDRYRRLADAFAFAETDGPRTKLNGFATEITERFRRREFEVAVGRQDEALRLALNAQRDLDGVAADTASEDTRWFRILGDPPLRRVFEVALGLSDSFAQLDLDRQLSEIKSRAGRQLDIESLSDLAAPERQEGLIRRFLLRDQVTEFSLRSPQSVALVLLQNAHLIF